jgi:hypothetical protein
MITQQQLKSWLSYDPIAGEFTWLADGRIAGSTFGRGYLNIKIDGQLYKGHRLAWLYMTGRWPRETIDHADRNPRNNKWANLREATLSQNLANRRGRSNRKYQELPKGVSYSQSNRFQAAVYRNGIRKHLGTFATVEQAANAYQRGAVAEYGEFAHW